MIKLADILKQVLQEEKTKRDRCLRIADRKFNKPSAYKSGAVVRCRKGNIWKGLKETDDPQSGKAAPYGSGYKKLDEEINEVGEANLTPYKWKEEDVDGYWTYVEFTTDEGTEYNVGLEVMNYTPKDSTSYIKALNVEFATVVKDVGGYNYSSVNVIMNKGELYRVMSTIVAIVKHYIKKYKIQAVIYSPSKKTGEKFGAQRDNLYKAFISKAIYGIEFQQKGNMVVAILPNNVIQEEEGKAAPYRSGYSKVKEELILEKVKETLRTWFKRSGPKGKEGGWVDCNTCKDGSCKACGRKKGEKRSKYPSCRPTPAQCKDKGKGKKWGKTK